MKKLKNLTLACLVVLGIAACADDKSDNPPVYNSDETVTLEFTGEIGKEAKNTITFTNPHATDATFTASLHRIDNSIVFDIKNSTCDKVVANDVVLPLNITSKLAAGKSCEITYTYKPTELDTKLLQFYIGYEKTHESICPTADTVPSFDTIMTKDKNVTMNIYNYAKDSKGNKSPEYINVEIPAEYSVSGITDLDIISYTENFKLPAKKGEYKVDVYGASLESDNENNCSISNNILTVKNDNVCSLKVTAKTNNSNSITFTPKQEGNPYYHVNVDINSSYSYYVLSPDNQNSSFQPYYSASMLGENTYFDAAMLKKGEKVTSYEITGTDAKKFKVSGTAHNSCTVTDKEISLPANKTNCFYTVELVDTSKAGSYNAELKTTLSDKTVRTYKINGTVDLLTIDEILYNYCSQNTKLNKAYKLF